MAEKMNPTNYNNMMEALRLFAAKTEETSSELATLCSSAAMEFGDEDLAAKAAAKSSFEISARYYELAGTARNIAAAMEEELEIYYEELANQNSDDADDDF